jgi:metallophosphoesterase superfamily enzyme
MSKDFRPRLKGNVKKAYLNIIKEENRVLVIGDLHEPFCLDGYLEFCKKTYAKYNCNKVVFIGDVIDSHYSSYHETDPDGMGGGDELDLAIKKISKWYKAFPDADVTIGNHDLIVMRKAHTGGIPKKWIKSFNEVLETPGWRFVDEVIIDLVLYCHGIGSKAHIKAQKNMQSTVCGHHHIEAYVHWFVGRIQKVFGLQVGSGLDIKSYAAAYGKWFPKPAIGCAVVINGKTAINELMDL